jgi:hypothetical protein
MYYAVDKLSRRFLIMLPDIAQKYANNLSAVGFPPGSVTEAHDANGTHPVLEFKVGSPEQALDLIRRLMTIRQGAGLEKKDLTFFDNPSEGVKPNGSIFINPQNIVDYDKTHGEGELLRRLEQAKDKIRNVVGDYTDARPLLEAIGAFLKVAGITGVYTPDIVGAGDATVIGKPQAAKGSDRYV